MSVRIEPGGAARRTRSRRLDGEPQKRAPLYLSKVRLGPFALQADEPGVGIEAGVVASLLARKIKIQRFEVELFGSLQIFEVESQPRGIAREVAAWKLLRLRVKVFFSGRG